MSSPILTDILAGKKIITVSGLHSGIGKTLLSEHIISLVPEIYAIKITINDAFTAVSDDESVIMVSGKDTWRLKTGGARKVVWIQSQEEHLAEALVKAVSRIPESINVLIEGNSVLHYMKPDLAIFICDQRLTDIQNVKPSRQNALQKADVIINNLRSGTVADTTAVENICRQINDNSPFISLDISQEKPVFEYLETLLCERGFS